MRNRVHADENSPIFIHLFTLFVISNILNFKYMEIFPSPHRPLMAEWGEHPKVKIHNFAMTRGIPPVIDNTTI